MSSDDESTTKQHAETEKNEDDNNSTDQQQLFKRKGKKGNFRKKPTVAEESDGKTTEEGSDDSKQQPAEAATSTSIDQQAETSASKGKEEKKVDFREIIEETKLRQKLRSKHTGVKVSKTGLLEGAALKKSSKKNEEEEKQPKYGLQRMETFTNQTYISEVEKKMIEYIEEQLKAKGFKHDDEEDRKREADYREMLERTLYETPEHLKIPEVKGEDSANRWLVGLEEIELPVEYKIKNIEETERAKQKALEEKKRLEMLRKQEEFLPANVAVNFSANRQFFANGPRYSQQDQAAGAPGASSQGAGGGKKFDKKTMSTDEQVYERFKKRFRYR